jgi:gluconokinase
MELIRARLAERQTHFMPVELLDSQLATLEPPQADEKGAALSIDGSQARIVARAVQLVGPGPAEEA